MLLHYPRTCLGVRSLGDLFVWWCFWCCVSVVLAWLVCVRLFDSVFARRGYCFILGFIIDVVVVVGVFVLVGGVVVAILVLGVIVVLGVVVIVRVIVLVRVLLK